MSLLQDILEGKEDEHLEFKEAKNQYPFEDLVKYCVALANEGGGKMILGVTDKKPRRIVGSRAFSELEHTRHSLHERLKLKIEAEETRHHEGRVVVFNVPSRSLGTPVQYKGAYWMRAGDSVVPMTPDQLKNIFDEAVPDFSAEVCSKASLGDLDPAGIKLFRDMWVRKSGNQNILKLSEEQLLSDAELVVEGKTTYAALILFGTRQALGKHLAQSEVVFEYRSNEVPGPAADRREFRQGFLPVLDQVWNLISLRNDLQHFQQGLFVWDVPTFNERAVREAVLNAVSHRDYRSSSSVFVRQFSRRIEIVSPGGLPPGVTTENILWQQNPRNRRIAEVLGKCGLVERAGQGLDLIYRECIRQSKPLPNFSHTDTHFVWLTLHGEIQDPEFLRFLEEISQERLASFYTEDFLLIDLVHRGQPIPAHLKPRIQYLLDNGVIESQGRGRGVRLFLSRKFYRQIGKPGVYTRKRGLDRETNKQLLLKHISDNDKEGSRFKEFIQVLPALSVGQLKVLLLELKKEGKIQCIGNTRAGLWHLVPKSIGCELEITPI